MELLSPIEQLCEELKLPVVAQEYNNLSIIASQENWKYSQFLEELLRLSNEVLNWAVKF
jgi:hypothetical protein